MKTAHCVLVLCFLLLVACVTEEVKTTQPEPTSRVLSDEQWSEDLDSLYTLLKEHHQNLYKRTEKVTFQKLFAEIKEEIPSLEDHEITARFAQFVALANDGHTRLTLPLQKGIGLSQAHSGTELPADTTLVFRHLPVEFYWFDDGLFITRTTHEYTDLLGREVVKINDVIATDALESARSLSHFDNEYGHKLIAPSRLAILEILKALHIVEKDTEQVTLTVELDGSLEEITLTALSRLPETEFLNFGFERDPQEIVLTRQKNNRYYWYTYLEKEGTLYLQINQMNNEPEELGLIKFLGTVDQKIKQVSPERIVLDLRNNFGGDNGYSIAIVNLLLKNPELNQPGRFYTLIGRKTFSAAQHLVNDLRRWTDVIFVGEPTGSSPSSFGDAVRQQLPNSKLTVRIATIYWTDTSGRDQNVKWVAPDLPVPNLAADYFKNEDAAFRKCLEYPIDRNLADMYEDLYNSGGMPTATRLYIRLVCDWDTPEDDIAAIEDHLVKWMEANQ